MKHPWSHRNHKLAPNEWLLLKDWLKNNPEKRYEMGDVREDGKVFFAYDANHPNGERWRTKEGMDRHYAQMRQWYQRRREDPAFRKDRNRAARERYKNPAVKARVREGERIRNRAHPEKQVAKVQKRNARKTAQLHPELDPKTVESLYLLASTLSIQTQEIHQVDHIIPLAAGGWHHHDNLQVLPASTNKSKGADPFWTCSGHSDWRMVPVSLWPTALAPIYSGMLCG